MTERGENRGVLAPFEKGGLAYPNRVVFSPVTRARASCEGLAGPLQAEYYSQRASAGLLIAEATAILPEGRGGAWTPGLHDEEQVEGWRLTTDAVHAAGGRIFAQLWHAGRQSHSSLNPQGLPPGGPVGVAPPGSIFTEAGMVAYETPRALTAAEIEYIIRAYRRAAENALRAGFDGVEIHAAHGYLLDSFLRDGVNNRDDFYGGSLENRARLLVSVMEEVVAAVGGDRVSVRLAPNTTHGGMTESDPTATFGYVIERMNAIGIGWLDLVEGDNMLQREVPGGMDTDALAQAFKGAVILNHGYTLEMANEAIAARKADMIAFGRDYIANPDLVERFRFGLPLAAPASRAAWYGGGAEGLVDFPRHPDSARLSAEFAGEE